MFDRDKIKNNPCRFKYMFGCLIVVATFLLYSTLGLYQKSIYNKFSTSMTFEEMMVFRDILRTYVRAVEKANITYFMSGGTLLGSYMHHGMIPWDDDVDFWHPESERENLTYVLSSLGPKYILNTERKDSYKFYSTDSRPISNYINYSWPFLDLFFFVENRTHLWLEIEADIYRYEKVQIFPLTNRVFWYLSVKSPRDAKAVLLRRYDIHTCKTNFWNHSIETPTESYNMPCHKLWNEYPFVFRESIDEDKTMEILKNGNTALSYALMSKKYGLIHAFSDKGEICSKRRQNDVSIRIWCDQSNKTKLN